LAKVLLIARTERVFLLPEDVDRQLVAVGTTANVFADKQMYRITAL
jgi:hypothetical protein